MHQSSPSFFFVVNERLKCFSLRLLLIIQGIQGENNMSSPPFFLWDTWSYTCPPAGPRVSGGGGVQLQVLCRSRQVQPTNQINSCKNFHLALSALAFFFPFRMRESLMVFEKF